MESGEENENATTTENEISRRISNVSRSSEEPWDQGGLVPPVVGIGERKSKEKRWTKEKHKLLIQHYMPLLLVLVTVLPLVPFVIILVRSILRPGLHYCELDPSCPSVDLTIIFSDAGSLAFGIVLYFVFSCITFLILFSSGSWNSHAFRNKLVCMFSIYFMFWSIIQFSATAANRGYVIPYSVVQNYSIQIQAVGSGAAVVNISNFYSQFYGGRHAMLEVVKVHHPSDTPQSISPTSKVIYSDHWRDATEVIPDYARTQTVDQLENEKAYLFIFRPAKKVGNSAVHAGYRASISQLHIPPEQYSGTFPHDLFLDLRAFQFCFWEQDVGCT